jgi:hypothetical protein
VFGGRVRRLGALGQALDAQLGVVFELDVAGQAGAHAQLLHALVIDLQDRGRQAIEQVVQEHGAEGLALMLAESHIARQHLCWIQGIHQAQPVAAGMVLKDAVAAHVAEHLLGAIGGDVTEAVVIVGAVLGAQLTEGIQEVAGEQAHADAQLQNEQLPL